jgi:hypothetical protein
MKLYAREIGTAAILLVVVEAYFWSQSRSSELQGLPAKLIREIGTAAILLVVVEAYFWSQSRSSELQGLPAKLILVGLYALAAGLSQITLSRRSKYRLLDTLKSNVLLAAILSCGVTGLAFAFHRGIVKDVPFTWSSVIETSIKVFATLGVATAAIRMLVAVSWRRAQHQGGS